MGNDTACKVVGIDMVKVKMYGRIILTFSNMRHVPTLKKNLISLGALDANGYTYSLSGDKLKIFKGSIVIMIREMLPNNLYKLLRDIIFGEAAISKTENSENDSAYLCHHLLGHISERAMEELHKRKLLKNIKSCKLNFCKYCGLGKQTKVSFKFTEKENRAKRILDYIHSDAWGLTPRKSHGAAIMSH